MDKTTPSNRIAARIRSWVVGVCRSIWMASQTPIQRYLMESQMRPPKLRGVILRAYRADDFEACRLLHDLNAPNRFPEESSMQHEEYLREQPKTNLVAEFENRVIGCGGFILGHPDFATFVYGLVHPKYQRMGVGRLLFFGRLALLPKIETDSLICLCVVKASLPYYKKFGFVTLADGWKDSSGLEHPMAIAAVNADLIQRANGYLQRSQVPYPDLGHLEPVQAQLLKDYHEAQQLEAPDVSP